MKKEELRKSKNYKELEKTWLYRAALILPLKNRQKILNEIKEEFSKNKKQFGKRSALRILIRDVICLMLKILLATAVTGKIMIYFKAMIESFF